MSKPPNKYLLLVQLTLCTLVNMSAVIQGSKGRHVFYSFCLLAFLGYSNDLLHIIRRSLNIITVTWTYSQFFIFFYNLLVFKCLPVWWMWVYFTYVYRCLQRLEEDSGYMGSWSQLRSSEKAASVLNYWTIPPATQEPFQWRNIIVWDTN